MRDSVNVLDAIVLRRAIPESGLIEGDVGSVVHVHGPDAFEVEFVTGDGTTLAVASLGADDVRPIDAREVLHVRTLRPIQRVGPTREALNG